MPNSCAERPTISLCIGDERLSTGSAGFLSHVDPCSGEQDASVPLAGAREIDRAVTKARAAYTDWCRRRSSERRDILLRLASLVEEHTDEFARRGTLDNGTTVTINRLMVTRSVEWIRYYAGWADKIGGAVTGSFDSNGEMSYVLPQPFGVIGCITTWNGPLISMAMKVAAALAAGNAVVVKPSEITPFTGVLFADLASQSGLPDGALSILPGAAEAGRALVSHPHVKKASFTGGHDTARAILHLCAENVKPAVMELGGKSANIVFDDADLDNACALGTMLAIGVNAGQGCALPTRMLVAKSIYSEVLDRVSSMAKHLSVGDPFDPGTASGPVVSERSLERILGMIHRAEQDGARILTGGQRLDGEFSDGYFLAPTVFADVRPDSELAQKEVFGPVLAIMAFDEEDDAIDLANSTPYGLSGHLFTRDVQRAHRVAERLETGEVLVNGAENLSPTRPFGGVGISGMGREGAREGLDEFLRTKAVAIGTL